MKGVRGCGEMKRDVAIIFLCYIKTIYFLVHCCLQHLAKQWHTIGAS